MSSVLIVDDEPRMREILVRWLAPAGYAMREAPDADACTNDEERSGPGSTAIVHRHAIVVRGGLPIHAGAHRG